MGDKAIPRVREYKLHNISFVKPEEGVDYHWCYKNFTSFHKHNYYEFIIITEGKMKHWHNDKTAVMSKGMFFLVKPGEYHQFLPYHNSRAKQINFSITPTALETLYTPILKDGFLDKINKWEFPENLLLPQEILENTFRYVDRINQFSPQSSNIYATIKLIILELILYLMERIETNEALTDNQALPEWLLQFLDVLKNPNVFTMKLKDIYPLAPYSQSMLNIHFNKYMGMTLITHITNLKISYACNLLRYTDDSTLDVSTKLGYDSLSHFNRVFKKITGKTPIEYKKANT